MIAGKIEGRLRSTALLRLQEPLTISYNLLTRRTRQYGCATMKLFLIFLLAATLPVSARAQTNVEMTFSTVTAPHAAFGALMGYQFVVTNPGTTTITVTQNIDLTGPDAATATLLTQDVTLAVGETKVVTGTFKTSNYSSLTGAFTLRGFVTETIGGGILAQQEIPLTVVPVPDNLVYASIGGLGPATASWGSTCDFQTVVANLSSAALMLTTNTTLILTDGTESPLSRGKAKSVAAQASVLRPGTVTTSQYNTIAGAYAVRVDVLNEQKQVIATDTYGFDRTPLNPGIYPPTFTDTATAAGINFPRSVVTIPGCDEGRTDVLDGGAGIAVADYDGDGWEDMYVVDMHGTGYLWHNEGDGTFTDQTVAAQIPFLLRQSGASFADIDNDGYPDLLLLAAEDQMMLLHNQGDGSFVDLSATAGLTTPADQNLVTATWGDYDNDGYLDLYVASHVDCDELNANDHLFHNHGDNSFEDVSSFMGGSTGTQLNARGMVPLFVDYNGDGQVDLYVGNDVGQRFYPNVLWRNDGPDGLGGWTFTDVSSETYTDVAMSAMGIAVGDYQRNGGFNFLVTNVNDNILLQRQSDGTFLQEQGNGVGGAHVARPTFPAGRAGAIPVGAITWNTAFYDFDNDGWEDLYLAGGPIAKTQINPNVLFLNNRDGTFLDTSLLAGITGAAGSMPGTVFADFDKDGFMDVYQSANNDGVPHLYMNSGRASGNPNHWLEVKLIGTTSNRDAVGAHLVARVGSGSLQRWVISTGFQGNSTLIQHFGLGTLSKVSSLTVTWPSGKTTRVRNLVADQRITITE